MKGVLSTLAVFVIISCNNFSKNKIDAEDTTLDNKPMVRSIEAGGKLFGITDSLVGSHTMMGTYTMSEYFGISSDSLFCSLLVTDSAGKLDELLVYRFAKTEIDTVESYTEGISFGEKKARMLILFAKPGNKINGRHTKADGNTIPIQVEKVEINFDDAARVDSIAAKLHLKN